MMTRRLRLVCALVLALQVLATSGEAGAWNQITHQYINDRVLKEKKTDLGVPDCYDLLYVYAGSYPDMGYGDPEIANRFHGPALADESSELTGVAWTDTANFAGLWQATIERGEGYPEPYATIYKGWGGHIAADWVAHTWVPLADDPFYNIWHLNLEVCMDAYLLIDEIEWDRPSGFTVRADARLLRGLLVGHAMVDGGDDPEDLLDLRGRMNAEGQFDLKDIEDRIALFSTVVVGGDALAWRAYIFKEEAVEGTADHYDFDELLAESVSIAEEWANSKSPLRYRGIPSIEATPVYDPTCPPTKPPPGAVTPPRPESLSLVAVSSRVGTWAEGEVSSDPHEAFYEILTEIGRRGTDAGLMTTTCHPVEGEPDWVGATTSVSDWGALAALAADTVEQLALGSPGGPALSPAAQVFAASLDRLLNQGLDPEAAADMTPPYVVPVTPLPDASVCSLRPEISARLADLAPSAGLDPSSLSVTVDGAPVPVALAEGGDTFTGRAGYPVYGGYHTVGVAVADRLGQETYVEWPFAVALDLTWLPPVGAPHPRSWRLSQTVPVKFSLRDEAGAFGTDPGVTVRLSDPEDASGLNSATYAVGEGPGAIRINQDEEHYLVNVKLSNLRWMRPGMIVHATVQAGGIVLGELDMPVR
jgi:hypothetical protein